MRKKIAFIGVGNMAGAIISGITSRENDPISWSDILLFDKINEQTEKYAEHKPYVAKTIEDAAEAADCIVLSVKPQNFPEILPLLAKCKNADKKLYITIAAGIKMQTVHDAVGGPVVRVLPNTPMLIGKGVSAICRMDCVSDGDFSFACDMFSASGSLLKITEDKMNAIISVTSSSPAYVFMLIKAMYNGALEQGLISEEISEKQMLDAICDVLSGSAELLKRGIKTPEEQIQTVASKGGTTERAINELSERGLEDAVISAMLKCTARADELSASK